MGMARLNPNCVEPDILATMFRGAADVIVSADGDRDHMNPSNLKVEQTLAFAQMLRCAADKINPRDLLPGEES